jgi:molybdate transport system substrate-binding protein
MSTQARLVAVLAAFLLPLLQPSPLTVSAATSLTDALEEISKAYAAGGGGVVRLNVGGSNTLARQIVNGAPADIFISADEAQMAVVENAGLVQPGSRVEIVRNQLAVMAAPDRVDLVRDRFAQAPAEIRRVAIGDPVAVPAGVYARQYLERRGIWKAYEPRVVPAANVRAALVAVETGGADAAIVYVTDAAMARRAVVAFVVPLDETPPILYPAAILGRSRNINEAQRFMAFLRGPEASAVFARHKFLAPSGK